MSEDQPKYNGPDRRESVGWHLSREIGISHIITTGVLLVGLVSAWYTTTNQIAANQREILRGAVERTAILKKMDDHYQFQIDQRGRVWLEVNGHSKQFSDLNGDMKAVSAKLNSIDGNLNRLIDKLLDDALGKKK
jgi:hypothetical protein